MKEEKILQIVYELFGIFKRDDCNFSAVSSILMMLSEVTSNAEIRSFCIDASIVIGESIYDKPISMSFEELEENFKKLCKEISA